MKKTRWLKVVGLIIPLLLFSIWSFGQAITVQGTVRDAEGQPLPGVSIVIQGTTKGAISNQDGNYSLDGVSPDAVLLFSFVGMETKSVPVGGQTVIDVEMVTSQEELEEVVVVGYGTQQKEAVTGSVASMSGDVMRQMESSNASQALQGRIPGVEMSQNSTKPGIRP